MEENIEFSSIDDSSVEIVVVDLDDDAHEAQRLLKPIRTGSSRSVREHREILDDRETSWKLDVEDFASKRLDVDEVLEHNRELPRKKKKGLKEFYVKQNARVDQFVAVDRGHNFVESDDEKEVRKELEARKQLKVKIAIYGSFILNVILFGLKIAAAVLSHSLAVVSSAVDSFLDLLSGSIIFITSCLMKRKQDLYLYPAGNSRIEPIGVIIFASAMFVATFQLITQAGQALADISSLDLKIDVFTMVIIGLTVVIKFGMWIFCACFAGESSSVKMLATDHRNDVFSNLFGLAMFLIGYYVWPYADPMGAIVISIYLMISWYLAGKDEVVKLSGVSAPPDFLSKLTFLAWNHHEMIVAIDTVRAYHLAEGFFVEVDIVLPHDMMLREAHDIGDELQEKLEKIDEVERAFVHLDWEDTHRPEH